MSDGEWELIGDLIAPYWTPGSLGRPVKVDRRRVWDAIFHMAATDCQWRALPSCYPNWNTVHRYHLTWSRDGTWEAIAQRLAQAFRELEGRDPEPSAGAVDARTVRGAASVTSDTRGYDAGKKISGRKTFGIVDTLGLLLAVTVVAAITSDNAGRIVVVGAAVRKSSRLAKIWCDAGSRKRSFVTVVRRISQPRSSTVSTPPVSRSCRNVGSWNEPGHG